MSAPALNLPIEQYVPVIMQAGGLYTALPMYIAGDLTVTGTTNIGNISLNDLSTTGNTTLGNAVTDTTTINGATTIATTSASGLTVGRQGATDPALLVDASTATSITGLKVKSAASGGGLALSAVGETNVAVTLDAAGSGTITLNATGTGNIVLGRAATGVSLGLTGALTAKSGTAVPATAGAVAAGAPIVMFSTGISVWVTSDAPTHSATKGDLCINTGGSSSSTRLFINNGTTNWIAVTTAS